MTILLLVIGAPVSLAQSNNQTLYLDQDGQAVLDANSLELCFESEIVTTCTPSRAIGDDHAIWLSNNIFPGSTTDFLFESGAEFSQFPDGTATITGVVYNTANPTDKWEVKLFLSDKKNWSEWSAAGHSYKDERGYANSHYTDWTYYIEDPSKVSELVGLADNAGSSLTIEHMPSNYYYGFQVGTAANNKNGDFGLSGWFSYSWDGVNFHQGDFNLDLNNCEDNETLPVGEVTRTLSQEVFTCDNLGENTVTLTATDEDGNVCTQEFTVTIEDNIAPTVVTRDIARVIGSGGQVTITADDVLNFNCGGGTTVPEPVPGSGEVTIEFATCTEDNCTITSKTLDKYTFDCNDIGVNTVTVTVTDQSGNSTVATATVTIVDNQAPAAIAQDITIPLDADGIATITPEMIDNGSNDGCGDITLTLSKTTFNCDEVGPNTVTLIATDAVGNTATATATVTVVDDLAPTVVTQNILIYLDENGNGKIRGTDVLYICEGADVNVPDPTPPPSGGGRGGRGGRGGGGTPPPTVDYSDVIVTSDVSQFTSCTEDNCAIVNATLSKNTFNCSDIGEVSVMVTVTDSNGNISTGMATVTVADNTPPTLTTQDVALSLDANGNASLTVDQVEVESADNCGIASKVLSQSSFDCDDTGVNTVTLTVTDNAGNQTVNTFNVTISDVTPPTVIAQDLTIALDNDGLASITTAQVDNGSSDNCNISLSLDRFAFDCSDVGQHTVTLTGTDPSGNTASATATITIVDNTAPTAIAQDFEVFLDQDGVASITPTQVDNGSSDNCGIASITLDRETFGCADLGQQTVTLTVTDTNGNSSTATATITVTDNIAPTVVTRDIARVIGSGGQVTITADDVLNFNCGGGTTVPEPVPGSGEVTIEFATCTEDNCTITSKTLDKYTFDCNDIGVNTVTVTVTDQSGNSTVATATVTIVDNQAPAAIAQDITIPLDADGIATITPEMIDNGSNDGCGDITLTLSKTTFNCDEVGPNTVTLIATDAVGNTATATATVTVVDDLAPTVVTQNILIYLDENGNGKIRGTDVLYICEGADVNVPDPTPPPSGGGRGGRGGRGGGGTPPPTVDYSDVIVTSDVSQFTSCTEDNCAIVNATLSKNTFNCSDIGEVSVMVTVTDSNGNISTGMATVTVADNTPPTLTTQDVALSLDANGNASLTVDQVEVESADNCGIASKVLSQSSFDCDDTGVNTVTLTVTDNAGNQTVNTFNVTISDVTPPTVIAQDLTIALDNDGLASITTAQVDNGSSDNCNISLSLDRFAFDCSDVGQHTVTLTGTDPSGNTASATATITIVDNTAPTAIAQDFEVFLDQDGVASITPTQVDNGSSDNCGIASITLDRETFGCADLGQQTVTLTVTDTNGNSSTATATITVTDNIAPTVVTRDIARVIGSGGQVTITADDVLNFNCGGGTTVPEPVPGSGEVTIEFATCTEDNCTITSKTLDKYTFDCNDIGVNTVTVTVTDQSGNSTVATATVTIVDNQAPAAIAQDITIPLDADGIATITPEMIDNGSNDGCGDITLTLSKTTFNCDEVGPNTVTLIATDAVGNTATATATVTVVDDLAPTVVTQNILIYLDENGNGKIRGTDVLYICEGADVNVPDPTPPPSGGGRGGRGGRGGGGTPPPTVDYSDVIVTSDVSQFTSCTEDNCAIVNATLSKNTFNCSDIGEVSVMVTVTDSNGNISTGMATVTVADNTPPTLTTQDVALSLDANGNASLTVDQVEVESADNCGIASKVLSQSSFDCDDTGVNTVTLTVTDNAGNQTVNTFNVTISDVTPPTVIAQDLTIALDNDGLASITTAQVDNGSSDNCNISLSLDRFAFDCSDVGQHTVTLTGTDPSGNTASATATITIVDNTAPTAIAQDFEVFLDQDGVASITPTQVDNGSSDNCGIASITLDRETFGCADLGQQTVTLTVTDTNGNSSTATATITVTDNIAPTVVTRDIARVIGSGGQVTITADDVLNFNCGGGTTVPEPVPGSGEVTIEFATCTEDNCTITSKTLDKYTFDCNDIGVNTVTVTVTDQSGNSTVATATVTIVDNQAPAAIAQDITIPLDADGIATITPEMIDNGSNDGCGDITLTLSKTTFNCDEVGPNTVTLIATDAVGNTATATATVTVVDDLAPTVVTQNILIYLDENGNGKIRGTDVLYICEGADVNVPDPTPPPSGGGRGGRGGRGGGGTPPPTVDYSDVIVTSDVSQFTSCTEDNCAIVNATLSKNTFNCSDIGEVSVMVTVTDSNGNISTGMATVTVADNTPPTLTTQDVALSLDANGNASLTVDQVEVESADNCGIASKVLSQSSFDCDDTGVNTVTLTVTDNAGNQTVNTFNVTISDVTPPTVIAQDLTIALDNDGLASITTAQVDNGSSDNCNISLSLDRFAFDCSDVGQHTVTLTGTDPSGNTASATATITIVDNTAPTAIAQDFEVFLDQDGVASITPTQVDNGSSDNCGIASITLDRETFGCADLGQQTVTLTVTDTNGNSSTATATITVTDNIAPTVVTRDIARVIGSGGQVTITADDVLNFNCGGGTTVPEPVPGSGEVTIEFATCTEDNCTITSKTLDKYTFDCNDIGVNTVTVTVTDQSGNSTVATATVTIVDNQAPAAIAQDITIPLDADGIATITPEMIDNGSNDGCGDITLTLSKTTFNCDEVGPNTVTLIATDAVGNTATATATVTVVDDLAPTVVTQNILIYLDENGNGKIRGTDVLYICEGADVNVPDPTPPPSGGGRGGRGGRGGGGTPPPTVDYSDVIVTSDVSQFTSCTEDNCAIVNATLSKNTFNCSDIGEVSVMVTVTDSNGNISTGMATVTVADNTPPTLTTQDVALSLDANGNASLTVDQVEVESADNCGIASKVLSQSSFDCDDTGVNTVTLTVTDNAGNQTVNTFNVTISDVTPPTVIAQDLTIALDNDGLASITTAQVDNGSSDNCNISLSLDRFAFDCSDVGQHTVTLTGTDPSGNTASATATITIVDNTAPTAIAQDFEVFLDQDGVASITPTQVDNGSSDNCGIASITLDRETFGCADLGQQTVTLTVTDTNGNSSTATATITVTDNIAPTVVTRDIARVIGSGGQVTITADDVLNFNCGGGTTVPEPVPGSGEVTIEFATCTEDNCTITSKTLDKYTFDCNDIGVNTVTVTVTDQSGNSTVATATVTIVDNQAPAAIAQDITIPLDADGIATITPEMIDNGSNDGCGDITLTLSKTTFNCDEVGPNTVTLIATDAVGNTATATATVTVVDDLAPTVVTQNILIYLDENGNGKIRGTDVLYICEGADVNVPDPTPPPSGGGRGGRGGRGGGGTPPPTVDYSDVIVTSDVSQFTSCTEDNCAIVNATLSKNTFNCSDIGEVSVMVTVTDSNGNISTGMATVTVADNTPPTLTTQDVALSLDANGNASLTVDQVEVESADNCGIASKVLSQSSFDCDDTGVNTVTLTVTDNAGNQTVNTFNVTISDVTPPTVIAQDLTIALDNDGLASITTAQVDNGSSDNCNISLSLDRFAFDCSDVGQHTVTLTGTDPSGNTASATATITIVDNTAPTAIAQDFEVFLDQDGVASITPTQVDNGSSDNCGIASITLDRETFGCADLGQQTVTLTVTDTNGNSSTATATITVTDNIAPTVVTRDITVALDTNGEASITIPQVDNGSSDNCNLTLSLDQLSFNCNDLGANTVTLTGVDASGNTASATATVTVIDNIAPTAIAQNLEISIDENGQASISADQINNGSTDNCGITSITISQTDFDCSNIGENTVTLTVTDNAGNTVTATATVVIKDTSAPTVIAQDITVALDANGEASITIPQVDNGSSDNCNLTLSLDQLNFNCDDLGANTVTLTGVDASGNTASATATVTVIDNIAPTAIAQNLEISIDENGQASISADQVNNGSTDNCGIASIVISQTDFDCTNIGENTITLTVTDNAGNVSTATSIVTIVDNAAPSITTLPATVSLDENGVGSITPGDVVTGITTERTVKHYGGSSSHAIWLSKYTPDNQAAKFHFLQDEGSLAQQADGTATITGTLVNINDENDSWIVQLNLIDRKSWDEWSALGRSWKGKASNVGDNYLDWNFYIMDTNPSNPSTLTGLGSNSGKTKTLAHAPANYNYGFQIGEAANDKDTGLGFSGWFTYQNDQGNTVQGDFNLDITSTTYTVGDGPCATAEVTISTEDFTCTDLGQQTITITATDNQGNAVTETTTVTVIDEIAPTVITQNLTIALDKNGQAVITTSQVDNGSNDNCNLTLSLDQLNFNCDDLGANTVTLTGVDASGNTASATATVTVVDNMAPAVTTQNVTLNLDANGSAQLTTEAIEVSASTDNCGIASKILSQTSFDCTDIGANVVTYTVTDGAGNSTTQTITVTIVDNITPTVIARDISLVLDQNGSASISVPQVDNGSNDNCDLTLSLDKFNFDCNDLGTNTVTLTGVDASGNTASATATVTVIDNSAPVVTVQDAVLNIGTDGTAQLTTDLIEVSSSDNCGIVTKALSRTSFDCSDLGNHAVTYTVTDNAGNTTTKTVNVRVQDITAPTVIAQDITVALDTNGEASITIPQVDNGSSDNCNLTLSLDQLSFNCNDLGTNTVTLTGVDASGNTASATATVTVIDNIAPTAIAQNLEISIDENGQASISADQINNGSTDNCGITSITISQTDFDCTNIGENTITLTVTDNAGNVSTTTSIVTIVDNAAPSITTLPATVSLDENGVGSITPGDVVTGITTERTVKHYGGSSSHAIWLSKYTPDNQAAKFHFLQDEGSLAQQADGTATITGTLVNINDENDSWIVQLNLIDRKSWDEWSALGRSWKGKASNVGDNYLDWNFYIMDTNPSNPSTLTGLGSNSGKTKTLAHAPANYNYGFQIGEAANDKDTGLGFSGWFTYQNDQGNTVQGDFNLDITSTTYTVGDGPCATAEVTISTEDFTCTDLGQQTITITATDNQGNAVSETTTVTVIDEIAPTVITQNITVALDKNGQAVITTSQVDNGSNDNCNLTLSLDQLNFNCDDLGANTVTLTGVDASGNTASATATVTVVDEIAPNAIAQNLTVHLDEHGSASISASQINNGSTDNCGVGGLSVDKVNFDCSHLGDNIVTLTVTDISGNTSTAIATVTVIDNVAPQIAEIPSNIVYHETDTDCGQSITWTAPHATDNCLVTLTSTHAPGDVFPVGTTTVTYTATDDSGNSVNASFDVTVVALPIAITLDAQVFNDDEGYNITCNGGSDGIINATVEGGCAPYTYSWSNGSSAASVNNLEAGSYTLTITDANGVQASQTIELTEPDPLSIETNVSPSLPGGEAGVINTIYLGYGEQSVTLGAAATGGNGEYSYEWSSDGDISCIDNNTATVAPKITTNYTVKVTDANGCTTERTFTIYVIDIRCEGGVVSENPGGDNDGGNDNPGGDDNGGNDNGGGNDNDNDDNGNSGDDDDDNDNGDNDDITICQCEGKMQNFTVTYNGVSGATIQAYKKNGRSVIKTFYNVKNGDQITVNGFDKKGRLDSKTYLRIGSKYYEIHTSCSESIIGKSYGPFKVDAYTDGEGAVCMAGIGNGDIDNGDDDDDKGKDDDDDDKGKDDDDDDNKKKDDDDDDKGKDDDDDNQPKFDDDDNGLSAFTDDIGTARSTYYGGQGNINQGCDCEGGMKEITVVYNGTSGTWIKAYNRWGNVILGEYKYVQKGQTLVINGYGSSGLLDYKTYLKVGAYLYKIYTSCYIDIVGRTYGPFTVTGFKDKKDNTCSINDTPDDIEVESTCDATSYSNNGHALWLSQYSSQGSARYMFENGFGTLSHLEDGTATVTGTVYNKNDPSDKWDIEFYLDEGKTWNEWSALGRSYKDEQGIAGSAYQDWTYHILDVSKVNRLVGKGSNTGRQKIVSHMPSNYQFGFQIGNKANNKNANYGISGWFYYKNDYGHWVQGDINMDLSNCDSDGSGNNGDCDLDLISWNGNVTLCYQGQAVCVSQEDAATLIADGAKLGSCAVILPSARAPKGVVVTNTDVPATTVSIEVNAYPNPTRDRTTINVTSSVAGPASVNVYNNQGHLVGKLFEGETEADRTYSFEFDGTNLVSGLYMIRVNTAGMVETKKLIIKH